MIATNCPGPFLFSYSPNLKTPKAEPHRFIAFSILNPSCQGQISNKDENKTYFRSRDENLQKEDLRFSASTEDLRYWEAMENTVLVNCDGGSSIELTTIENCSNAVEDVLNFFNFRLEFKVFLEEDEDG